MNLVNAMYIFYRDYTPYRPTPADYENYRQWLKVNRMLEKLYKEQEDTAIPSRVREDDA